MVLGLKARKPPEVLGVQDLFYTLSLQVGGSTTYIAGLVVVSTARREQYRWYLQKIEPPQLCWPGYSIPSPPATYICPVKAHRPFDLVPGTL